MNTQDKTMQFKDFKKKFNLSIQEICKEILKDDGNSIRIKNQRIGIQKLEKIIETAISISNKKGFHAMSLRELCGACGLSMGGLYGYIKNKDELLQVIQDQGRRMLLKVMAASMGPDLEPEVKLEQALYAHLYLSELTQPWFFFSYMESRFFNKEEQNKAMETELLTEKIFSDIIEAGKRTGTFRVEDPVMTAAVIKAMLQEWYLKRWKYARRNISVEAYARFIIPRIKGMVRSGPDRKTEQGGF